MSWAHVSGRKYPSKPRRSAVVATSTSASRRLSSGITLTPTSASLTRVWTPCTPSRKRCLLCIDFDFAARRSRTLAEECRHDQIVRGACAALLLARPPRPPGHGQVFLASRPHPDFLIGPLFVVANVSPGLGPVTVNLSWSLTTQAGAARGRHQAGPVPALAGRGRREPPRPARPTPRWCARSRAGASSCTASGRLTPAEAATACSWAPACLGEPPRQPPRSSRSPGGRRRPGRLRDVHQDSVDAEPRRSSSRS